jgi:N-methylhydantoinase A/oxoprolinase/acetone carboxylase beta subunit
LQAVWGIHDLINETMAGAAKTHIAEKGGNPEVVTVSAFGGAGPVHAYGLAKKLGAGQVLIPPNAGVASALGFFTAPRAFDLVRSHKVPLDSVDFAEVEAVFHDLEQQGVKNLKAEDTAQDISFERSLDMRFIGQDSETNVPIPRQPFDGYQQADIRERFDRVYQDLFGRTYPEAPVEFVNFRVRAHLPKRPLQLQTIASGPRDPVEARKGTRPAYSAAAGDYIPYTVYDRYRLFPGMRLQGPAIIEERESTLVAGEDAWITVDEYGFLWMKIG